MTHSQQYPRLYPLKLPENARKDIISSWMNEKNAILNNGKVTPTTTRANSSKSYRNSQVIKRRNETFAEAEQRLKIKNIEIGIIGPGEITGLSEIIFDLPNYMQSIRCIEDCDVFFIYKRSYDRLISKRNPICINKMKDYVYMKLLSRNNRLSSKVTVDLYRSLQYRIELSMKKRSLIPIRQKSTNSSENQIKGPIIQLDTKPKLAAYNRLNKRKKSNRHEELVK